MRLFILVIIGCFYSTLSDAQPVQTPLDYAHFATIPVLHEGRIKPLDSLARIYYGRLRGSSGVSDESPITWLAQLIFEPDSGSSDPFIRIENPRIVNALKLTPASNHLYTPQVVRQAYQVQMPILRRLATKDSAKLNAFEFRYLELFSNLRDYEDLSHSLRLILPYSGDFSPKAYHQLNIPLGSELSVYNLADKRPVIESVAANIHQKHQGQVDRYSEAEQQISLLAFFLAKNEAAANTSTLLRVIPAFLTDPSQWYTPAGLLAEGHGSPQGLQLLNHWQALALAYLQQDGRAFSNMAGTIQDATGPARQVSNTQLTLERWYHQLDLISLTIILYSIAFLLYFLRPHLAKYPFALAVITHISLIGLRVYILGRPPVSSLYESILFVALVSALLGLVIDRLYAGIQGRIIGCVLGASLLLVSTVYAESGDTMNVLIAVLNTNFWLATHVICITLGYGCALVAGCMGHLYLLRPRPALFPLLHSTALVALLLTSIGTILGGIWADQSWGRFWGWDPKENGALLIVLWLIWLLHGKLSGHLKWLGFAAWLAGTNVVVALSWFGVNLLNVGLHSYGFTDKAAYGLGAFCALEIAVITGLYMIAKQRQNHAV